MQIKKPWWTSFVESLSIFPTDFMEKREQPKEQQERDFFEDEEVLHNFAKDKLTKQSTLMDYAGILGKSDADETLSSIRASRQNKNSGTEL